MIVRAVTAGVANAVASPARQRSYLAILNQSATATVYVAFDVPAVAAAAAGQLTIGPNVAAADEPGNPGMVFHGIGETPWQAAGCFRAGTAVARGVTRASRARPCALWPWRLRIRMSSWPELWTESTARVMPRKPGSEFPQRTMRNCAISIPWPSIRAIR